MTEHTHTRTQGSEDNKATCTIKKNGGIRQRDGRTQGGTVSVLIGELSQKAEEWETQRKEEGRDKVKERANYALTRCTWPCCLLGCSSALKTEARLASQQR